MGLKKIDSIEARVEAAAVEGDRDWYAEGADAALAGHSDIPPEEVIEAGLDAEASWNDGYASVDDEEKEETFTTAEADVDGA